MGRDCASGPAGESKAQESWGLRLTQMHLYRTASPPLLDVAVACSRCAVASLAVEVPLWVAGDSQMEVA